MQDSVRPGASRGLLVLLGSLTALTPLSIDAYLPALPSLTKDLASTDSAAQLTLSALLVGLALGQLVAGPLSDRVGRRPPVLVGLAGFILVSLACAVAPNVPVLIALRLLQGLFGAAAVVVSRAVVRDLHEGAAAARAFATLILIMGVAPVAAPVLGAQILRVTSWRGVFVLLAVAGTVLLALTARRLPETLPEPSTGGVRETFTTFGRLLRDRGFLAPAIASGAAIAGLFAYIAGSPFLLQEVYGLTPQRFSLLFALNAATFVTLSQVGGRLVERTGAAALVITGGVMSVTGSVVVGIALLVGGGLPVLVPGLMLTVGAVGLIAPNATALALAEHAKTAGAASALLGLLQFSLGGAVSPLTGLGGGSTQLPLVLVLGTCSVVGLACGILAARRAREPVPEMQALTVVD